MDYLKYVEYYSYSVMLEGDNLLRICIFLICHFVKSLMVLCFCWFHGNINWDKSIVNLILVLIIKCWLHNMCIKNQFDPLFKGDILL